MGVIPCRIDTPYVSPQPYLATGTAVGRTTFYVGEGCLHRQQGPSKGMANRKRISMPSQVEAGGHNDLGHQRPPSGEIRKGTLIDVHLTSKVMIIDSTPPQHQAGPP